MSLEFIIMYSALIFWLCPPIRQYRGSYFYFFLTLALQDPVTQLLAYTLLISPNIVYACGLLFLLMTLVKKTTLRKFYPVWFVLFILLIVYNHYRIFDARYVILLEMLILVYLTMKRTIKDYMGRQQMHIPHIVLLLYTVSLFAKFMFYVLFKGSGYLYFYLTTVFENFVAIYFTCIRLDDFSKVTAVTEKTPSAKKAGESVS